MAIKNIDIKDLPTFGRRLMELAKEREVGEPKSLAELLYEECKDLVEPDRRKNKYGKIVKDYNHDISAIRRMVQQHFNEENAWNIQSPYMLAYSKVFNCSLDYLYGKTNVKRSDVELQDICKKTHLSEKVITRLQQEYSDEPDVFSTSRIWIDILESELFDRLPEDWFRYSAKKLEYKKFEDIINNAEDQVSLKEPILETIINVRKDALIGLRANLIGSCEGAYSMLSHDIATYIEGKTEEFVDGYYNNLDTSFYYNKFKETEIIDKEIKKALSKEK